MSRLVEGLWDCPYCEAKGIGGLEKTCPNCGHPQDKGTKFYIDHNNVRHLSEQESKETGTKQDWICAYCGSYNNDKNAFCTNCGSSREEKDGTYFSQKMSAEKKTQSESLETQKAGKENFFKKHPVRVVLLLGLLVILVSLGINLIPSNHAGIIQDMTWERSIQVEEFKTVRESDWNVPEGGILVETRREIRSYQQVVDHYENVAKQVAYEVADGYDTEYRDNGNGTFSEISIPRYRTEYRTEYVDEPVYREEPVYDNKYYYDIDKWCDGQLEKVSGTSDEKPRWPDVKYAENQREKSRQENYVIVCYDQKKDKIYPYLCDQSTWEKYKIGQPVDFVVKAGKIIKMD